MDELKDCLSLICKKLFNYDGKIEVTIPEEQFGDFTTNIAMQLAKELKQNPKEIANQIINEITKLNIYKSVQTAGPGFINISLNDTYFSNFLKEDIKFNNKYQNQEVVVEYSDPNPFKILHAGHLYTSIVGDAIANILQYSGGNVHRVNFGGDVGLHVAKTMWSILRKLGGENPDELTKIEKNERSNWLTNAYVEGNNLYEDDEEIKKEIVLLNKKIYSLHQENDRSSKFAQIYWTTRQWSYDYFDEFYKYLGSKFEKYYPESATFNTGLEIVNEQLKKDIFKNSDGAVIFDGEKFGLHTRVFINKEGLPTYETKDIGLIMLKKQDYNFDKSIVVTANEQEQYMQVVLKAVEQFYPELAQATTHITHGLVKPIGGEKMSSRKGNILSATDVIDSARNEATKNNPTDEKVVLAAVKYAFLKQRIGADIIYDPKESVSIEGNSGPYLLYAYVRAKSILDKTKNAGDIENSTHLTKDERSLIRKLSQFPEVLNDATNDLMPHHICTYIYELAQNFNRFYEDNRIIGDERENVRIKIVNKYAETLKKCFEILNIPIVEKM